MGTTQPYRRVPSQILIHGPKGVSNINIFLFSERFSTLKGLLLVRVILGIASVLVFSKLVALHSDG